MPCSRTTLGMVNVHASLLPRYRGAAPVHRAVIAGERETGVTIMRVVRALDAGPMLAHVRCAIGATDTSEEVERDLATLGADLLISTLDRIASGTAQETPQDDTLSRTASLDPRGCTHRLELSANGSQTLRGSTRGRTRTPF